MKSKLCNLKIEYLKSPIGLEEPFPHFSWEFKTDRRAVYQTEYRIVVKAFIDEIVWDSGIVKSDKTFGIRYGGEALKPDTCYRVEVYSLLSGEELFAETEFRTGLMGETISGAKWICAADECSSPLFRKTFYTGRKIAYATLYIAARGFYEPYINGKVLEEMRVMRPAMGSHITFPYTCVCDAYDITDKLSSDNNTVGVWLGRGYQRGYFNKYGWLYEGGERLWCAISIQYQDGDSEFVVSDESWLWHQSPVVENSIYDGETYNKNLEIKDWSSPYLDVTDWQEAQASPISEWLRCIASVPIIRKAVRPCENFITCEDEVTICDFGVNGAGFVRIKVMGEPGTKVIIEHAENITESGELNFFTNRNAKATDVYILKGYEIEIYEPRFTYHCFRYAKIRMDGVAQLISANKITIGSDFESVGFFQTDNAMLQRFYNNAFRSAETNLVSFPSDCASRDERTPCLMDNMAFEEFAIHLFDMQAYYRNWLRNSQKHGDANGHHPMWNGELIELPRRLFEYYGDYDILEEMYPVMKQNISQSIETYEKTGFDHIFGDWCAPNENNLHNDYRLCFASSAETGLCHLIYQLGILEEISSAFGIYDESEDYKTKREYYINEYYKRFYNEEKGVFSDGAQTPNILALALGVVRDEDRRRVYEGLLDHIENEDKRHLATGIAGTQYLMSVLYQDERGRELLSEILNQTDYPSFGQQVLEYDATCLCEQWLGLEGMMSCNHPMFGGMFADYYKRIGGIKNLANSYKEIKIEPILLDGMREMSCIYKSVRGEIAVYLKSAADGVHLDVVIPPNCRAKVVSPDGRTFKLENGKYML